MPVSSRPGNLPTATQPAPATWRPPWEREREEFEEEARAILAAAYIERGIKLAELLGISRSNLLRLINGARCKQGHRYWLIRRCERILEQNPRPRVVTVGNREVAIWQGAEANDATREVA